MILRKTIYTRAIKRIMDIICSLLALLILSPVFLIVAILVKIKLGSPVLFCQERPGKDEKIYRMYKFRSMTNERDKEGRILADEDRLTHFGKLLRSTSLDELPELINVLKGDMSLVGPRPLLVKYLPLYNERQRHRHDVRPGITGYAQINGRNAISWEEKFEKDIWYVENISFVTDMKIIFGTVGAVLNRKGISSGTSETMEEFIGNVDE